MRSSPKDVRAAHGRGVARIHLNHTQINPARCTLAN